MSVKDSALPAVTSVNTTDIIVVTPSGGATSKITIANLKASLFSTGTASILLSSTTVNLNEGIGAKQPLYTCPSSRRAIVTNFIVNGYSGAPNNWIATVGWAAGADDVSNSFGAGLNTGVALLSAIVGAVFDNSVPSAIMVPVVPLGTAGDILGLKVQTPEGSALTAIIDVFGYLTTTAGVPVANIVTL